MKRIKLRNSPKHTLVDDDDYERCLSIECYLTSAGIVGCYVEKVTIPLANFIMKTNLMYDHKDRNTFNNQRTNLRICNYSQNNSNKDKYNIISTSIYKGVSYRKDRNKWSAYLRISGKLIHLGHFKNEKQAAKAYNRAATKHFGEFAVLNKVEVVVS